MWAFALSFIAHLAKDSPGSSYRSSFFRLLALCMPQGYGLGSEFRPADDQIAIVKLIKCLDHKKAKEIKSKSLGRKLKSFLSSHTHTHTRTAGTHTQSHSQTRRHAQLRDTQWNGSRIVYWWTVWPTDSRTLSGGGHGLLPPSGVVTRPCFLLFNW